MILQSPPVLVSFSKEVLEQMLNLEPGVAKTQVIIVIIDNIWRPRWSGHPYHSHHL